MRCTPQNFRTVLTMYLIQYTLNGILLPQLHNYFIYKEIHFITGCYLIEEIYFLASVVYELTEKLHVIKRHGALYTN